VSARKDQGLDALHAIGRGTSVLVVGTVMLFLLSFVGRVYTARYLSVAQFGAFNLSLALTGLLSLVALVGLHQASARAIAHTADPALRRRIIRTAAVVTAVAAVITSSLVWFLAGPLASLFGASPDGPLAEAFELMAVTIGFTLGCTFLAAIFQGFEKAGPNAIFNQIVQPAAFVVFVYLFFHFHLQFTGAILAWTLANAVAFVAILAYTLRRLPELLPAGPTADSLPRGMLSMSLALWGVSTLSYVTAYFDTLLLGVFHTQADVGIYSAALTMGRLLLAANGALTYIYLPVVARLQREGDLEAVRSTYVTSTRWILLVTVPLFLLFAALPVDSMTAVYGPAYASGYLALAIVTGGSLISVALGPVNSALAGLGRTGWLLFATVFSAAIDVTLSFGLIPAFSVLGAAVAWTVARVAYPAGGVVGLYRSHGVSSAHRALLLPLGVTLAVGLPLFWFVGRLGAPSWIVFPLYPVGLGIYFAATALTRSFQKGDMVILHALERILGRPLPTIERFLSNFMPTPESAPAVSRMA
jgi:O-antigen/teichoic acid export membrane protein